MPSMLGLVRRDADEIRELRPRTALGALVVVCALLVLKLSPLFWSALGTAIAAPAVFSVLRRLDKKLLPAEGTTLVR